MPKNQNNIYSVTFENKEGILYNVEVEEINKREAMVSAIKHMEELSNGFVPIDIRKIAKNENDINIKTTESDLDGTKY